MVVLGRCCPGGHCLTTYLALRLALPLLELVIAWSCWLALLIVAWAGWRGFSPEAVLLAGQDPGDEDDRQHDRYNCAGEVEHSSQEGHFDSRHMAIAAISMQAFRSGGCCCKANQKRNKGCYNHKEGEIRLHFFWRANLV